MYDQRKKKVFDLLNEIYYAYIIANMLIGLTMRSLMDLGVQFNWDDFEKFMWDNVMFRVSS